MKRTGMLSIITLLLIVLAIPAWAAKPSVVTKVAGEMRVVRVTPDSHWLAGWSRQTNGEYKMVVVDTDNGGQQEVCTANGPGGLAWVPKLNRLFYCQGFYSSKVESSRVRYDIYDPSNQDSVKISDTTIDITEMYLFDPLPAEDGTRLLHVLIDSKKVPNFITYFPHRELRDGVFSPILTGALIASEYDLSSDGRKLYWYGHSDESGKMMIIEWDLETGSYSNIYDYSDVYDPSEDHALFKVDSPNQQAVTLAASSTEPTLQMTLFSFANPNKLQVTPVYLAPNQEVLSFEWKGRGGWLSVLIRDSRTNEFLIMEVEPLTGTRNELLRTTDEISYIDYNSVNKMYYYSVVDARDPRNPISMVMRLPDA